MTVDQAIVQYIAMYDADVFFFIASDVQEGMNAERFARLYGDRPDVVVPGIWWEYTSPKVITMDWIQGTKLDQQESLKEQGLDVLALVNNPWVVRLHFSFQDDRKLYLIMDFLQGTAHTASVHRGAGLGGPLPTHGPADGLPPTPCACVCRRRSDDGADEERHSD